MDANTLIDQLVALEYVIRQSTAVREDQEDNANSGHLETAKTYGINAADDMSKGDLLNAVQTRLRKLQTQTRDTYALASIGINDVHFFRCKD